MRTKNSVRIIKGMSIRNLTIELKKNETNKDISNKSRNNKCNTSSSSKNYNTDNMNNLIDKLEKEMECCICFGILQKPLVLSCGHMICEGCSKQKNMPKYGSYNLCPQCRQVETVFVYKVEKKKNKNKNKATMRPRVNKNNLEKKNGIMLQMDFQGITNKLRSVHNKYQILLKENEKKAKIIEKQKKCLKNYNIFYDESNDRMVELIGGNLEKEEEGEED